MTDNKYRSEMKEQFKDKIIVVTGSTQGMGAETAKLFASRGAKSVVICGNIESEIRKNIVEIYELGQRGEM